jgi:hypothetical protein
LPDEPAALLAKRFIARRDVKAVQQSNGAYHPDRTKFTMTDLRSHIAGTSTFGHYLVSQDDECKLFAFDLDLKKTGRWLDDNDNWHDFNPREAWLDKTHPSREQQTVQLRCLAEALALRARRWAGVDVAVSYSGGKGLHVYGWTGPVPAAEARRTAIHVLDGFGCFKLVKGINFYAHTGDEYQNIEIEVYPKQDSLENKDLGNLLRLPLGINRKTKQRAYFLDMRQPYNLFKAADPIEAMSPGYEW